MNDARNPYRPGKARVGDAETPGRPVGLIIAAVLEAWTALYTAITAPGTLKEFRQMLAGFGAELSPTTKAVLAAPGICWIFAIVAVAQLGWILARKQPSDVERRRMRTSLWIFGVVFGVLIGWAIYGLYAAIFKLGAVV